jgi:hypothetical protein
MPTRLKSLLPGAPHPTPHTLKKIMIYKSGYDNISKCNVK